jgi:hypothetical protein
MNFMENKTIKFWEQRDFGTLIGAPFYFLRQEFKPFSLVLLKYAGPFLALAMLGLGFFSFDTYSLTMNSLMGDSSPNFAYLILFLIFFLIGLLSVFLLTNSYVTLYVKAGRGNFSEADVVALAKRKVFPMLGLGFLVVVMVFVGMLLFYLPGIYLGIALSFVYIALFYEGLDVGKSISRSFEVVRGKWWITFALILVFGMIVGFTSYLFFIPGYLVGILALATDSFGMVQLFIVIIFAVLYFAAYLYMLALQQILIAFQYFNILTEKEGGNLNSRIDAIYDEGYGEAEVMDEDKKTDEDLNAADEKDESEEDSTEKSEESDDESNEKDSYDRFSDPNQTNRFTDKDDDPYKPKY